MYILVASCFMFKLHFIGPVLALLLFLLWRIFPIITLNGNYCFLSLDVDITVGLLAPCLVVFTFCICMLVSLLFSPSSSFFYFSYHFIQFAVFDMQSLPTCTLIPNHMTFACISLFICHLCFCLPKAFTFHGFC